jgi:hypothetical protein
MNKIKYLKEDSLTIYNKNNSVIVMSKTLSPKLKGEIHILDKKALNDITIYGMFNTYLKKYWISDNIAIVFAILEKFEYDFN